MTAGMDSEEAAYHRGHLAGEVAARLAHHDRHFEAINGHLAALAADVHQMRMQVQRLADQRDADIVTVKTTADAVEKTVQTTADTVEQARVARRDTSDQSWSPVSKAIAVLLALAAIGGLIIGVVTLLTGR